MTGLLEGVPISLLGHSAGALVAVEACFYLKRSYGYTPQRIINVGMAAPHVSGGPTSSPQGIRMFDESC